MAMKNKWLRCCLTLGVVCLLIVLGLMTFRLAQEKYEKAMVAGKELSKIAKGIDRMIHYDELTHWQREEWKLDTFFHTPAAMTACEYISSKDTAGLNNWILAGGDVDLTGDHGMTLLFWAMLDRNMEAFQQLLTKGADPDKLLSTSIALRRGRHLFHDDTVMFAALELGEFDFSIRALHYSSTPDHRDLAQQNLILRLTESLPFNRVPPGVFKAFVDAGVDPNVHDERHGSVPAVSLLCLNRFSACHELLIAGADPTLATKHRESVVSVVRHEFAIHDPVTLSSEYQKLTHWLIDQGYLEPAILKINPSSPRTVAKP